MSFLDHRGKTVPSHIALDASGQLRAGFCRASEVMADGERFSFDVMMMDGSTKRGSIFLTDSERNSRDAAIVAAIRDARYAGTANYSAARAGNSAPVPDRTATSYADNSQFVAALRNARYL